MIEEFSGQFIQIKNFCEENELIPDLTLIIVGLSGGVDSILLFYFLLWLKQRKTLNFEIVAAHLNHQIRVSADQDQAFVKELCLQYEVPFFTKTVDIPLLAKRRQNGEEEAGRFARHQFFLELISEFQADEKYSNYQIKVALGHHQDDVAESVVMNIGRGAGLSGISTLRVKENFYIRPLLNVNKQQINTLIENQGWQWVEDQTNVSEKYLRNRIRHQLLPLWSEIVGYDVNPLIARLAANLNEDEVALTWAGEEFYQECLFDNNQLSLKILRKLPYSIFKQVIDIWVQKIEQTKVVSSVQLTQVWQIVHGEHGNKQLDLGNKIIIKRHKNRLIMI